MIPWIISRTLLSPFQILEIPISDCGRRDSPLFLRIAGGRRGGTGGGGEIGFYELPCSGGYSNGTRIPYGSNWWRNGIPDKGE